MGIHTHARYTDAEAIAAAKTDATLLNYTEGARVYHSVAQTIAHATPIKLAFDSERYDTDTIHDTVTNNSYLTCKTAGKYLICVAIRWVANATGDRQCSILFNGTTVIAQHVTPMTGTGTCRMILATIYDMAIDNFVEVEVFQTSTGNLNVDARGNYSPEFMMQRIG